MDTQLTLVERNDLQYCEQQIEKGLQTFIEVGEALWKIREGKLYRASYDTFEAYCSERWNIKKSHAYRLIEASEVVRTSPIGDKIQTESQARELARVEPERRQEVVEKVLERDGKVTARAIREAAEAVWPTPEPTPHEIAVRAEAEAAAAKASKESETLWLLKQYWKRATKSERQDFLTYIKREN